MPETQTALFTSDAVVLGILLLILAIVSFTSSLANKGWKKFYSIVPSILLCYFLPALFNTFGIIDGTNSSLYNIASRYFLPASLVLLTLGIDIPALQKLGGKALVMFFAGTAGVMIGGPLAFLLVGWLWPEILVYENEETWRGLATIAGSWIGGGANQVALLEVFGAGKNLFGQVIVVDVLVAYLWTGILLYATQHNEKINRWLKADAGAIAVLQQKMTEIDQQRNKASKGTHEWLVVLGVAFAVTAAGHIAADMIVPWLTDNFPEASRYSLTSTFFWIIIIATTIGLLLSFTPVRKIEAYGASDVGSVFLYFLIATIGMQMDLKALFNSPKLILVAMAWIIIHITIMIVVARAIRAPFFFVAVGSQANIGGPASAPIVAAAFSKYLAPVGVLLAILGYAVGTYGGYLCGLALQWVSNLLQYKL